MKRKCYYPTDFLFPKTNYVIGAGSIMALTGNYYQFNASSTDNEADIIAIRSDWECVGNDIHNALEQFDIENKLLQSKMFRLINVFVCENK